MKGLNYEIIECDIKLLNIKLQKIKINLDKLLLSKPYFFQRQKKIEWNKELDKLYNEQLDYQNQILKQYVKLENLLKKNSSS